jgi:hypothetical protein
MSPTVSPAIRRQRVLLALCALTAILIAIASLMTIYVAGAAGASFDPTEKAFVLSATSIEPGSAADVAGVRAGDTLDIRDASPVVRLRLNNVPRGGEPLVLPLQRQGVRHTVTVTPQPLTTGEFWRRDGWDQVLSMIGEFWGVLVAAVLVWRRPESIEAQLLAIVLILNNLAVAISGGNFWMTPWPAFDLAAYTISLIFGGAAQIVLVLYTLQFGRPISLARRVVSLVTIALIGCFCLAEAASEVGDWFATIDPGVLAQTLPTVLNVVGYSVMPVVCIVLAFLAARGAERPRIAWAGGSFVLLYLGYMFFQATANDDSLKHYGDIVVDVSTFVAPLGLTYALLNRRLLDVGFALNRAVVFTTLSLVIVGAFTLAEWALGSWLQSVSKATNLAVSAALALGLGLSIHPIHAWVDRFIDNVFFRKRHQDEKALRRFAHEAAFTTDPAAILERTTRELLDHAESTFANVLLYDGAGRYGDVDENDLALVALRASGERVDLHGLETAVHGDFAYPMVARGRFVGALVIGPKRSHEPYAPDESAAIAEVAHGVGIALDLLGVGRNDTTPAILDAIGALDRSINVLTTTIADRLSPVKEDGLIAG